MSVKALLGPGAMSDLKSEMHPNVFPILALGLAAVGTLSRVVIKIAAARRAQTIIDHPDPDREKRP